MPRDGSGTRAQIMDAAQALILQHGFAGTSVDAVLERTSLTKGAFFHHFKSKNDLARALIERFAEQDAALLRATMERAERLSRDPVQQLLIFVGLLEELAAANAAPPGCLYASYSYEAQLFDTGTHATIRGGLLLWRERLAGKLRQAIAGRAPRVTVDVEEVADMLSVIIEGAYVLSRTMDDPGLVAKQLAQYRGYLELLFGVAFTAADADSAALSNEPQKSRRSQLAGDSTRQN